MPDLHIVFRVFRHEPGLQFGKRRIGFAHDAGAQSFVMCGKLRLGTACPRARARLPRPLPPPEKFVDIGHANPEDGRRGISAGSPISPPPSPARAGPASKLFPSRYLLRRMTRGRESQILPRWNPRTDLINNEDALEGSSLYLILQTASFWRWPVHCRWWSGSDHFFPRNRDGVKECLQTYRRRRGLRDPGVGALEAQLF